MTGVVKFWNPDVDGWQVVGTGPRGDTGPVGERGPTGEMGPVGEVGVIACKMWRSAAFTPSTGVTVVPLDAVTFDTSNMADIANGRIKITTPGIYHVDATVNFNATATGTYTYVSPYILKNGAIVSETFDQRAITNRGAAHVSDMVNCVAGDYLQLGVYNQQGTALVTGDARNYLSVSLITAGVGPKGEPGDTGPPGGPTGPTGPTGPAWVPSMWAPQWNYPALSAPWTSYTAGGFRPPAYLKDPLGFVHFDGMLTMTGTPANQVAWTLPAGFRPGNTVSFPIHIVGPTLWRLQVGTDGNVIPVSPAGAAAPAWLSIAGATFLAEA